MKRTALRAISVAAVVGTAVMSVGVSGAATATHDAPAKPETVDRRYGRGPVALRQATVSQLRLQRMAREGHAIGNHSWQEPGASVLADRVIAGARAGGRSC